MCVQIGFDKKKIAALQVDVRAQANIYLKSKRFLSTSLSEASALICRTFFILSLFFSVSPSRKSCNKNRASHLVCSCMNAVVFASLYDGCYTKHVVQCVFFSFFCVNGSSCFYIDVYGFHPILVWMLELVRVLFIVIHSNEYG